MTTGLTLGKYAPLHRGHQLVIETALAEMDETVVIVHDSPQAISVPLAVRSGWIRSLYPSVRVIEAWDGPGEVGYSPEITWAHERYLIDSLGIAGVTHFYSSEPYGDHVSRALGRSTGGWTRSGCGRPCRRATSDEIRSPTANTCIRSCTGI